jgi:hypothetical protein
MKKTRYPYSVPFSEPPEIVLTSMRGTDGVERQLGPTFASSPATIIVLR